ncbi:MAG: hypothetical protein JWM44_3246 [Bacilli bacterium]|nr:hypothetical protein [Bacilli bacterium]
MKSIDEISKSWAKKQKYLGWRILLIFLLTYFGLEGLYNTENISKALFLNTTLLFSLPLLLEYFKGMDTYSSYTSFFRWIGLILNGFIVLNCFLGHMGTITVTCDVTTHFLKYITVFGLNVSPIAILCITWLMIPLSIMDFIFSFNKREVYFLNAHDEISGFIEENYGDFVKESTPDARKEHFKKQFTAQASTIKTDGGV